MHPYVYLFGNSITSYSLMFIIGCVVVLCYVLLRALIKGLGAENALYFFAFVLIGALIGSKVLYLLIDIPDIWAQRDYYFSSFSNLSTLFTGGFVFYGGLFGGVIGAVCYAKVFKVNAVRIADNFIPAIPLFHAFGRIGCFLAGCCYGIPYTGIFAVTFTEALSDANGVSRFPVQLLEAAINIAIFVILILFTRIRTKREKWKPLQSFGLYLLLYGAARFILEYLRGDAARGVWGPFSTSQWISLVICIPLGLYMFLCPTEKNVVVQRFFNFDLPNESPIPKVEKAS